MWRRSSIQTTGATPEMVAYVREQELEAAGVIDPEKACLLVTFSLSFRAMVVNCVA